MSEIEKRNAYLKQFPNENQDTIGKLFDITTKHISGNYEDLTPIKKGSYFFIITNLHLKKVLVLDKICEIIDSINETFDSELESYEKTLVISNSESEKYITICNRFIKKYVEYEKSSL